MIELSGEADEQSRDTTRQLKDTATETRMTTQKTTRNVPTEAHKSSGSSSSSSDGRAMLQKWLDLPGESHRETRRLQEALKRQMEIMRELLEAVAKQQRQWTRWRNRWPKNYSWSTSSSKPSLGSICCTHRGHMLASNDPRHSPKNTGTRVLRDDVYPMRVDNVSRNAMLNQINEVRVEVAETLGREDDNELAKVAWLSRRDVLEAYGSMVVYFKKHPEAKEFISEGLSRLEESSAS
ncbi:hypothetical protein BFJ71_g16814 [Fusarium oxysporum]|nr:hypothetical protein BFJ71_g16814 [Fusarium oxysporum]